MFHYAPRVYYIVSVNLLNSEAQIYTCPGASSLEPGKLGLMLTICSDLKVASWTQEGLQLHDQGAALTAAILAKYAPCIASARVFAERRVVQLGDGIAPRPLRFSETAVRAVRAVALKCGLAESAAVLKLLTKYRDMPIRDGQHTCCFCGQRHFYTTVAFTLMKGCYHPRLSELSDFRWLAMAPRDEWHSLVLQHHSPQSASRLGRLSRVLSEALHVNRWGVPCHDAGCTITGLCSNLVGQIVTMT
eukprot:3811041-Amphidinium_carterae.3